MEHILLLLLILFLAKVFGEVIERAGFPSILGEIFAGVFLGLLWFEPGGEVLSFLAELGAIFLLFTAGYLEVNLNELRTASRVAFTPTMFGIAVPFLLGYLLGQAFGFGFLESLFMGVAFSPTSIGVVVKTLIDLKYLSSRPGSVMLTSAIFDDIIGIFILAIVVTIATINQLPSGMQLLLIAGKLAGFMVIIAFMGFKVYPWLFNLVHRMHVKEGIFAFVIMVALFSAYLAEVFGLHAVIGAFIGGALLSDIPFAKIESVQRKVSGLSYGIFVPIFFAFIGLSVDLGVVQTAGLFTVLVIVLALVGKLIGGFIGSKLIGFEFHDSLIFGIGMMPRAGVELVVLSVGKGMGLITDEVFSAIVLMVVVSIIVSPMLLKFAIGVKEKSI
ncbi:MAG: Kef-type K+ transport system, membrane component KefB [Candidatus Methanocomedens sp.]|nr:MAG: Kef-type K+ transport system, membrane component KefB [ANME-2 cluster archaeon]